jgi:hypothetical protein
MVGGPGAAGDLDVADRLAEAACAAHRHGQPLAAIVVATDPGAVLPASFDELNVVEEDQEADVEQPREVALPGEVGRLVRDQHSGTGRGDGGGLHDRFLSSRLGQ